MAMRRRSRTRDPIRLIERVNRAWMTSPEREVLVPSMLAALARAVEADDASVLLLDPSGQELVEKVIAGRRRRPAHRIRVRVEGITGRVAARRRPAIVPDVRRVRHYVPTSERSRSEAAVPILAGERLLGVLNLESDRVGFFSRADLKWLEPVAFQFALALLGEEARERENRWAAHFGLLFNLSRIAYGFMAPQAFLQHVCEMVRRHLDCGYAAVFRGDYERACVVLLAHSPTGPVPVGPGYEQKFTEGLLGAAFRLGETVHARDVTQEPMYRKVIEATRSEVCVPIRAGDHCLGILDAQSAEAGAFQPDDVMLLEALARFLVPVVQACPNQRQQAL